MAAITMTLMPLVLFAALGVVQAGEPASAGASGEFAPHGLGLMQVTSPGIPPTSVARTRLVGDASLDA